MDEHLKKNILYDLRLFLFWLKIRSQEFDFTLASRKVRYTIEYASELLSNITTYCYYGNEEEIIEIYTDTIPSIKEEDKVESIFVYVTDGRLDLGIKFHYENRSHYVKIADRKNECF